MTAVGGQSGDPEWRDAARPWPAGAAWRAASAHCRRAAAAAEGDPGHATAIFRHPRCWPAVDAADGRHHCRDAAACHPRGPGAADGCRCGCDHCHCPADGDRCRNAAAADGSTAGKPDSHSCRSRSSHCHTRNLPRTDSRRGSCIAWTGSRGNSRPNCRRHSRTWHSRTGPSTGRRKQSGA
ncbi:hypothetical protein D3C71_1545170 [compost metagenome]